MDKKFKVSYQTVTDEATLDKILEEVASAPRLAVDLETSSLHPHTGYIVGYSLAWKEGCACYIPVGHTVGEQLDASLVARKLKPVIEDPSKSILVYNAKFESRFLPQSDIHVPSERMADVMLQVYVAAETHKLQRFGLKNVVDIIYHHKMTAFEELFPRGTKILNMATVPIELASPYSCEDADYTFRLDARYNDQIKAQFIYKLEDQLWPYIKMIEDTGFLVNEQFLIDASKAIMVEAEKVEKIIYQMVSKAIGREARFDITSHTQLQEVLYDIMGIEPVVKTPKGKGATSDLALERLAKTYPVCRNILTYRSMVTNARTMGSTLREFIRDDGRIHTQYNQAGATSGRCASNDPNMQNQAKIKEWEVVQLDGTRYTVYILPRDAFIAPEDYYLLELDFAAIEFIVMAAESGEESILIAYERGEDVHKNTASQVLHKPINDVTKPERRKAKTWNYLIIYGGGAYGLALRSGQESEEADTEIKAFFHTYPKILQYTQRTRDKARVTRKVCTHFGRWQWVPEYFEGTRKAWSKAERACVNRIVQGTAADIQKMGIIRTIKRSLKHWVWEMAQMNAQTHDSQTWCIHKSIKPQDVVPILKDAMSPQFPNYPRIRVDATVGVTWGSLHDYDENANYDELLDKWHKENSAMLEQITVRGLPRKKAEKTEQGGDGGGPMDVYFNPGRPITANDAKVIKDVLGQYPGQNTLVVQWDGQTKRMEYLPTSLTPQQVRAVFRPVFRFCQITDYDLAAKTAETHVVDEPTPMSAMADMMIDDVVREEL